MIERVWTMGCWAVSLLTAVLWLPPAGAQDATPYPLQVHMNQWLVGSREWRTPNPDYRAPESPGESDPGWPEFEVYWEWNPSEKVMAGQLNGVRRDGSKTLFWNLYAFYNPVTEQVLYLQVSRRGDLIQGESPVRTEPVAFGEVERLDTMHYSSDGSVKYTRHENVFAEDGTHSSKVYERGENGSWKQVNTWHWTLTSSARYEGTDGS